MKELKKRKTLILSILGVFILIVAIGGITFAFFNYTRTGTANTFSVGRISFTTNQTNTINLTNLFPINPAESGIMDDTTKVGTFTLTIEGDTDYSGGVEYLVSVVNSHVTTNTGQIVPISLDVTVEGLGTQNTNYFTARESKDSKIYKRLSGNGIMGDGNLLVGYIPQNTTSGTIEGINGKITIKAYLDASKIAITDTYDGSETDNMGTTNDWVNGRVVLTTAEWNALQDSGISFQVKVEANEDIWVEETLYDIIERQTVMDNINSTYVNNTTPGIDFSQISSDTNGKGVYTFSSTVNDAYPVMYYRGDVNNNNVLFANKCWKMVRTTDTGGVKLIYNGENKGTEEAPNCDNTGTDTQITLNLDGTDTNTFPFSGTGLNSSPAYNGYMWGTPYEIMRKKYLEGSKFGNSVTWDGTNYTIMDVSDTIDINHHYTCGTVGAISCNEIRYYLTYDNSNRFYFNLSNGKRIEDILKETNENNIESNAKKMVDTWYKENFDKKEYNDGIEDVIYCNDRGVFVLGALNPNGGAIVDAGGAIDDTPVMYYLGYERARISYQPSLKCLKKDDSFTISKIIGNGKLEYPVGLVTVDEILMAGGKNGVANDAFYLNSGSIYWSMSPYRFVYNGESNMFRISSDGNLSNYNTYSASGLRPVISLKNGTAIVDDDADGTVSKPYIIK